MKKHLKKPSAGARIMTALREILDAQEAGVPLKKVKVTVREVEVAKPTQYDARAVLATRQKLGVSQSVFAQIMGVSVMLAQAWEQGKRFPDGATRRLLDEVNRDPGRFTLYIRKAS